MMGIFLRLHQTIAAAIFLVLVANAGPAAGFQEPATHNRALALGGDGHVIIGNHSELKPAAAFTLEAWIRHGHDDNCGAIVSSGWQTGWSFEICGGRMTLWLEGSSVTGDTVIPTDLWTHVAVVFSTSGRRYYINGEQELITSSESDPPVSGDPVVIGADNAAGGFRFNGRISNVRLWNVARSQNDIRKSMHVALDEALPGLVANWRFGLSGDYGDNIGGFDGEPADTAPLSLLFPPPAQPARVELDEFFNALPARRYDAAGAYLPRLDQALIIGGAGASGVGTSVDRIDAATGEVENIGTLPLALSQSTAAYAASTDTVYTFGGTSGGMARDSLLAIDPGDGSTRELEYVLHAPARGAASVHHPEHDLIYIFGGRNASGPLANVTIFDPQTETLLATPIDFVLPEGRSHMGAAYASTNGHIYLFGGYDTSTGAGGQRDTVWEVRLDDDGLGGSVVELATTLDGRSASIAAAEDPHSGLIHLLGGLNQHWVSTFDPASGQLWRTRIAIPYERRGNTALYSPINRHALIIGGDQFDIRLNVWRVPLGDGPAIPIRDWRFHPSVASSVSYIHGEGRGVAFGTVSSGAYRQRSVGGRAHYTPANLGSPSGQVNQVRYNAEHDHVWIATNDAGGRLRGSESENYGSDVLGTNVTYSVETTPGYTSVEFQPRFGTNDGLKWRQFILGGSPQWTTSFSGVPVYTLAEREPNDIWLSTGGTFAQLRRLQISGSFGTETNFGNPDCENLGGILGRLSDMAFGLNRDWWLVSDFSGEFGTPGICRIPAAETPESGEAISSVLGNRASSVDTDAEGRVWVSILTEPAAAGSGGLAVFEVSGGSTEQRRVEEYNWLNAPLGSNQAVVSGSLRSWDSAITAVGAADERVWAGKADGRVASLAQRWARLDQNNQMGSRPVRIIRLVRGRAFLAASTSLHVLMPDGITWDNREDITVNDVVEDHQGRIWVATSSGVMLYTPEGWDDLSDREGTRPDADVVALAVDHDGRVWIGHSGGLTLYDRERFVFTLDASNSNLPADGIFSLFVDRAGRLWAGTASGLARLDGHDFVVFTSDDGLPSNVIRDITQLNSGEIVVGTMSPGQVAFFDGAGFSTNTPPFTTSAGFPLSVDDRGRLWAGRFVFDDGQWRDYHWTNSGLHSNVFATVATDGADRTWIGHSPISGVSVRSSFLPALANVLPSIDDVSPTTGNSGQIIEITGSGFGNSRRDVRVTIGQADAEIVDVRSDLITARITDTITNGRISIIVGGRRFTWGEHFCAIPVINDFTPTGGNDGVEVTVYGTNFDRHARLRIGSGTVRTSVVGTPTELRFRVMPTDTNGPIEVSNVSSSCSENVTESTGPEFRRFEVEINHLTLNQGYPGMGLAAGKPTLVQHYLTTGQWMRTSEHASDRLSIDEIELRLTPPGGVSQVIRSSYDPHQRPPAWPPPWPSYDSTPGPAGPMPPAWTRDLDMSLHTVLTPWPQLDDGAGPVEVQATLRKAGQIVAQRTEHFDFEPHQWLNVLLVPIMRNDYTTEHLNDMRARVDGGLEHARERIFHFGRVNFFWSPTVYRANDILWDFNEQVDVGDTFELYMASHNLDRARRAWNRSGRPRATIAFGVVEPETNSGTVPGLAFWPDASQWANAMWLSQFQTLCDIGDAVINFFTLGAVGGDGCDIEVPLFITWAEALDDQNRIGRLFAHEIGHVLGLVRSHASNGSPEEHLTHSVYNEHVGGSCGTGGAVYEPDRTLYRSPGFRGPAVNPLDSEMFRPRLDLDQGHPRGKAVMSYACSRNNNNVFFEPADMSHFRFELDPLWSPGSPLGLAGNTRGDDPTIPVEGQRLYVSGMVNRATETGFLERVEILGDEGPLDIAYLTGYALVQLDSEGETLQEHGVFPGFATSGGETDEGFFAATLLAEEGVTRIELRYGDTVLDTFEPGPGAPSVSISSPAGGSSFGTGTIPVSWTASDPDGDALEITIDFSADGGNTWVPVGFGRDSGTLDIPVAVLADSQQARIRVTASDGLNTGSAMSDIFFVDAQPPLAWIGAPEDGAEFLEGRLVRLSGGATDSADQVFDDAGLRWTSDRDGELGSGHVLKTVLSVGTHEITLEAVNSNGLSDSTSIAITIRGDYDGDGIADEDELAMGFNPLWSEDVWIDYDGDGLPLIMELNWGTDPFNPDTSGSGQTDAEDIGEGLNPLDPDDSLPPDALTVHPAEVILAGDRALETPLPQAILEVVSQAPVDWTVSSDQPWLHTLRDSGVTPGSVTVLADLEQVSDGSHSGALTFTSTIGEVIVPVVLIAEDSEAELPDEVFIDRFEPNPDD